MLIYSPEPVSVMPSNDDFKVYKVRGLKRDLFGWSEFKKFVVARNEKDAIERTYSLMGSNHKLKRNLIKIKGVEPVKDDSEVRDPAVRAYLK
jgi:large subunit ribosomal protein LX